MKKISKIVLIIAIVAISFVGAKKSFADNGDHSCGNYPRQPSTSKSYFVVTKSTSSSKKGTYKKRTYSRSPSPSSAKPKPEPPTPTCTYIKGYNIWSDCVNGVQTGRGPQIRTTSGSKCSDASNTRTCGMCGTAHGGKYPRLSSISEEDLCLFGVDINLVAEDTFFGWKCEGGQNGSGDDASCVANKLACDVDVSLEPTPRTGTADSNYQMNFVSQLVTGYANLNPIETISGLRFNFLCGDGTGSAINTNDNPILDFTCTYLTPGPYKAKVEMEANCDSEGVRFTASDTETVNVYGCIGAIPTKSVPCDSDTYKDLTNYTTQRTLIGNHGTACTPGKKCEYVCRPDNVLIEDACYAMADCGQMDNPNYINCESFYEGEASNLCPGGGSEDPAGRSDLTGTERCNWTCVGTHAETAKSCSTKIHYCGNSECEKEEGENFVNCPADCTSNIIEF